MKLNRGFCKSDNGNVKIKVGDTVYTGEWIYWNGFGEIVCYNKQKRISVIEKDVKRAIQNISEIQSLLVKKTCGEEVKGTDFFVHDVIRDSYGAEYKVVYDNTRAGFGVVGLKKHIYVPFSCLSSKVKVVRTQFDYEEEEGIG